MSDIEKQLNFYISEMNSAKAILAQRKGIELDSMELQIALCEILNIDSHKPLELVERKLSCNSIIDMLKDCTFPDRRKIDELILDDSILPDGTPQILTEQTVKVKGEVWIIYKNDKDPFPSSPHAHNYQSGVSLHLGTGEFFKKRTSKGFLPCKTLKALREKLKKHTLPCLDNRCK